MSGNQPLISVIVPVYNGERYIDRCLESLVNQTWKNIEIILVDDGSTDGSGLLCNRWQEKDCRIKVIHKKNGGVSSARNVGLDITKGEYIGFVDPDDYVEVDTYEFLYKTLMESGAVIAACSWDNYIEDEQGNSVFVSSFSPCSFDVIKCPASTERELYEGLLITCNKLFAREVVKGLRYNENCINGEDRLYCIQALANGSKKDAYIAYNMQPKYHYCHRKNSAGTKNFTPQDYSLISVCKEIINIVKEVAPNAESAAQANLSNAYLQLLVMLYRTPDSYSDIRKKLLTELRRRFPGFIFEKNKVKKKLLIILMAISPKVYKRGSLLYKKIKRRSC